MALGIELSLAYKFKYFKVIVFCQILFLRDLIIVSLFLPNLRKLWNTNYITKPHESRTRKIKCFFQRYLIEVDCSLGQFESAKLKDKEYAINAPILSTTLQKRKRWMHQSFNICWQMISFWFMLLMLYLSLLDIRGFFHTDTHAHTYTAGWLTEVWQTIYFTWINSIYMGIRFISSILCSLLLEFFQLKGTQFLLNYKMTIIYHSGWLHMVYI